MACIMWRLMGALVISMTKASQLVVPSHIVRHGEVEAEVGDRVQLRCLGGSLGWEGDDEGRYEEMEEAGLPTSITLVALIVIFFLMVIVVIMVIIAITVIMLVSRFSDEHHHSRSQR